MFIFINEKHEIKAIHKTNDESLKKIEICCKGGNKRKLKEQSLHISRF